MSSRHRLPGSRCNPKILKRQVKSTLGVDLRKLAKTRILRVINQVVKKGSRKDLVATFRLIKIRASNLRPSILHLKRRGMKSWCSSIFRGWISQS